MRLRSAQIFCSMSSKANGDWQFRKFWRDKFFNVDVALLLGNDYFPCIKNNGMEKVVQGLLPCIPKGMSKENAAVWKKRCVWKDDNMLNMQAPSEDPI